MTLEQEFKTWSATEGKKLNKWRYLDHDHKWFVFMNTRVAPGPKVVTKPTPRMVFSKSNSAIMGGGE